MKVRESIYKRYVPANECKNVPAESSYYFAFNLNKLLVVVNGNNVSIPLLKDINELKLNVIRYQFLGMLEGKPSYSVEVCTTEKASHGVEFRELRSLYDYLDEDIFMLAGKAAQIVTWDQTHQFCGRCGSKTETAQGERAKRCPKCGFINYPRISPAIITAILKGNKILLAHNSGFNGKMFSLIAGFLEPGETLEECVEREIMEEVGIKVKNIRYFGSQPWPFPNSMMIGYIADYDSGEIKVDGVEISEADWFDVKALPELPSKVSIARRIIDWYIEKYS